MRGTIRATLAMVALLLFSSPAAVQGEGAERISGRALIMSRGGEGAAGLRVSLLRRDTQGDSALASALTAEGGRFAFPPIPIEERSLYLVTGHYSGVEYSSAPVDLQGGRGASDVVLALFDTTHSTEALSVPLYHVIVDEEEGGLVVHEYLILENREGRTLVGHREIAPGKLEVFHLPLPEAARRLTLGAGFMECCTAVADRGVSSTMPLKPGELEVSYSYHLAGRSGKHAFEREVPYGVGRLSVFLPADGVAVKRTSLTVGEVVGRGDRRYQHLTGRDLPRGGRWSIEIGGLPVAWRDRAKWIALGVVILLALGGILLAVLRRRRGSEETPLPAGPPPPLTY